MDQRNHSRTSLFMTELILVLLFFSIAAACCLQVFARASQLGKKSSQMRVALNSTENIIQYLKLSEGDIQKLSVYYPQIEIEEEDEVRVYFDDSGEPCGKEAYSYYTAFRIIREDSMCRAEITCWGDKGEELCSFVSEWVQQMSFEGDQDGAAA